MMNNPNRYPSSIDDSDLYDQSAAQRDHLPDKSTDELYKEIQELEDAINLPDEARREIANAVFDIIATYILPYCTQPGDGEEVVYTYPPRIEKLISQNLRDVRKNIAAGSLEE